MTHIKLLKAKEVHSMNTSTNKVFDWISILFRKIIVPFLVLGVLCLMSDHVSGVSAQDVEIPAEVEAITIKATTEGGIIVESTAEEIMDDIIIADDIIYIDMDEQKKDTEAKADENDKESGEQFPPEVRKMMEKEGISPENLNDPEIRKEFRKKVEKMMAEKRQDGPQPNREGEGSRKGEKKPGGGEKGVKEGLEFYSSSIVKNNLFKQLGSGGEKKGPEYALTAVMSGASDELDDKAIIQQKGGGQSYYVAEGDTFAGGLEVLEIEDEKVTINKSGEEINLALGEGTSGGGRGRGGGRRGRRNSGGGGRSGGGNNASGGNRSKGGNSGGDDFDPSQIPPFARKMLEERGISIDQLRNNPELRNKLRGEFEQRFRGGGGGSPQVIQMRSGQRGGRRRNR